MKSYIAITSFVFAFVMLVHSQEDPDKRRQDLANTTWNLTSEGGCFMRQTMQDTFQVMDEDGDNNVTQTEYVAYVGGFLGNVPGKCMWGKSSAVGGDPITIPAGVNKIFEEYKPEGDCVKEEPFKTRQIKLLKECEWPEKENGQL